MKQNGYTQKHFQSPRTALVYPLGSRCSRWWAWARRRAHEVGTMGRYLKGPFSLGSVLCTHERPLEIQYNTQKHFFFQIWLTSPFIFYLHLDKNKVITKWKIFTCRKKTSRNLVGVIKSKKRITHFLEKKNSQHIVKVWKR